MILKKLKRTNLNRTKAAMIGGLVDYVLAEKDEDGFEKWQFAHGFNFVAKSPRAWKQEMIALSQETIHSRMPEIGPMNNYFIGSNAQNTTSDWVSGKDFVFDYMGISAYTIKGSMDYVQVWENGTP